MKVIVPLAGPDFERADGSTKAETMLDGEPLLRRILDRRIWWRRRQVLPADTVFVLRDAAISRRFAAEGLQRWYPGARIVFLSQAAQGAALSALAGVALVAHAREPFCIDLADIDYTSDFDPVAMIDGPAGPAAAALVFEASDPVYSYLRVDSEGHVVEAAEKRVISRHASAGTYFFASPAIFLEALSRNLAEPEAVTYQGSFFVCPVLNGVVAAGRRVVLARVRDVRDVKVVPP